MAGDQLPDLAEGASQQERLDAAEGLCSVYRSIYQSSVYVL